MPLAIRSAKANVKVLGDVVDSVKLIPAKAWPAPDYGTFEQKKLVLLVNNVPEFFLAAGEPARQAGSA